MIGHSKGGAEAIANAVVNGADAIIFNPATANLAAYNLPNVTSGHNIRSFVVFGEALNLFYLSVNIAGFAISPLLMVILGSGNPLFAFNVPYTYIYAPGTTLNAIELHLMPAVIAAMERR